MMLGETKPVQRLFWTRKWRPFKIVFIGDETGIPSMHQLMGVPGVLLELLHHCGLDIHVRPQSTSF
jgi:hypothetical protein